MIRALTCALALALARPAAADDMKPEARAHLERGLHAYDVQSYDEAIAEFRAGYRIDPRPELLYALAQAERLSGDCARAIEAYKAFLRTSPPARQARSAQQNLDRCAALLAARPTESAKSISLDAHSNSNPNAGSTGEAAETNSARPDSGATSRADLTARAPAPAHRPWYRDGAGDALAAVGVAGVVVGGALWGVGEGAIDAANAASRYDRFASASRAAQSAGAERAGGIAAVAVGGALVVGAIIHYAWDAHRRSR